MAESDFFLNAVGSRADGWTLLQSGVPKAVSGSIPARESCAAYSALAQPRPRPDERTMSLNTGDSIPDLEVGIMTAEGVQKSSIHSLFAGKKVVLFSVPGAFTPTCSDKHLPGFIMKAEEIKARGVDLIACIAVNDTYVMHAWGKARNVGDRILMLADGNGDFAGAMGLELDLTSAGMGRRSQRYAALIQDNEIEALWVEPGAGLEVSSAEAVLAALSG